MVEIIRNPQINWIKAKRYFIPVSIILLVLGALSVQLRGFNLSVDFTGGTLMSVRFKHAGHARTDSRRALHGPQY